MAEAVKFHWVLVDRDRTPEIPKRFSVSAYPSYLVLGRSDENVHRFKGYKEPSEFVAELREAMRRYDLYRRGEKWDEPTPREPVLCEVGELSSLPAPGDAVPGGLARIGEDLWVAQGDRAHRLDPETGAARGTALTLPAGTQDIATDGRLLYVVTARWTAGDPITVIDPADGRTVRQISTEANRGGKRFTARGLCHRDGALYVLEIHGRIHRVDPETGEVTHTAECGKRWLFGLAFDGHRFVTVSTQKAIVWLDPETLRVAREISTHYPLRAVGFDDGRYLLMEQPVFGHDVGHAVVRVWPAQTMIHRLRLTDRR